MNIGVGLPTSTSGINAELLFEWAKRADAGPFSSLGVVDRVAYQNYEPFTALAAAAAITRRVRLATMVAIAPLRNTAILAKQAATLDALSGGRLTLGLAVGARGEDYAASGIDSRGRGRRFGEQLEAIRDIWEEGRIGPTPKAPGPRVLVGGSSGEALARMARYADGYMHGGGPPRAFAGSAAKAVAAWSDLGRPGRP
ncbi:MAG TPA: LLM class flavin-dependent oxidoreductase, partial [Gemmatimonadales bacterium]|nr:LLM class flavin-dependent oxidoreductase [Gemmatimonadales bacterium]